MSPLIAIAANMLPELATRFAGAAGAATRAEAVAIVREVLGTDSPDEAAQRAAEPDRAGTLRLRLGELAASARAREAEAEAREVEARIAGMNDARSTFLGLVQGNSAFAWGPVVISCLVVIGFFSILGYLMFSGFTGATADPVVAQIINIAVGALTAGFATVLSFWLGSSDGSRRKDIAALQSAVTAAQERRAQAEATREIVREVTTKPVRSEPAAVETEALIVPEAAAGSKDALQFERCVEMIFRHEGGFADHPRDPGGATNFGITHRTLAAWRGVDSVTKAEVRALSRSEAAEIYRANYWNAAGCDGLPAGVDLVVFDFGVNAGVSRAAKLLQAIVRVERDGQVGPITQAAATRLDPAHIVREFSAGRMAHYRSLSIWDTFKNGWTRRTEETQAAALSMIAV